jgi:hypothetical protein
MPPSGFYQEFDYRVLCRQITCVYFLQRQRNKQITKYIHRVYYFDSQCGNLTGVLNKVRVPLQGWVLGPV